MSSKHKNLSDYQLNNKVNIGKMSFGIVVSEWNTEITLKLYEAAFDTLIQNGVNEDKIISRYVPGSFELPLGAQMMLDELDIDAVICLGCIIQGETRHFEFIANAVANGIMSVQLESCIPVVFGVLTTDTIEQAVERSGGKHGNKGVEAAVTAIKMVELRDSL